MLSTSSVLTFGLLWGAFASALLSRQSAVKIPPPFEVVKAAIGGILFGFGMPFAGGCASGTCWRAAEGSVKLVIAFIFMGVTNSLGKQLLDSSPALSSLMGREFYLPAYFSYPGTVIIIITAMTGLWLITAWNEKTRAFI